MQTLRIVPTTLTFWAIVVVACIYVMSKPLNPTIWLLGAMLVIFGTGYIAYQYTEVPRMPMELLRLLIVAMMAYIGYTMISVWMGIIFSVGLVFLIYQTIKEYKVITKENEQNTNKPNPESN